MRILTGGTRVGSLPRGFLGLLNILPVVGKQRRPLERWEGDPLGPWAGPGSGAHPIPSCQKEGQET